MTLGDGLKILLISHEFTEDCSNWFKTSVQISRELQDLGLPKIISPQDNNHLVQLPSPLEVREALCTIDSNKTPSLDEFGTGFFQNYWNIFLKMI